MKQRIEDIRQSMVAKLMNDDATFQLALYVMTKKIIIDTETPNLTACLTKDGDIRINPDFIESSNIGNSDGDIMLIILHECLHDIFQWFKRLHNKNPLVWNMASDYVINLLLWDMVDNDILKGTRTGTKFFANCLIEAKLAGMYEEEIYKLLMETAEKNGYNTDSGMNSLENPDDFEKIHEDDEFEVWKNKVTGTIVVISKSTTDIENSPETENELQSLQMKTILKGLGTKFGISILKNIEQKNRDLKFSAKFRTLIHTIGKQVSHKIWHSPKKSWMVNSDTMAMLPNPKKERKNMFKAVLVVDESGSMSDKDLTDVLGIVKSFVGRYITKTAVVIHHDCDIIVDKEYELLGNDGQMTFERKLNGGTSHSKPFQFIRDNLTGEKLLPILLSDMYSDIENTRKMIKDIPCIWVATENHSENTIKWLRDNCPEDSIIIK